jgi:hypothetical protein
MNGKLPAFMQTGKTSNPEPAAGCFLAPWMRERKGGLPGGAERMRAPSNLQGRMPRRLPGDGAMRAADAAGPDREWRAAFGDFHFRLFRPAFLC